MATISVIDDNRVAREAIADLLNSLGYEVATYESVEDFLGCEHFVQTSCLITDLQMPGLNGLDLQSQLIAERHCMPIIFVTAFPDEHCRRRAMSAGAIGF